MRAEELSAVDDERHPVASSAAAEAMITIAKAEAQELKI